MATKTKKQVEWFAWAVTQNGFKISKYTTNICDDRESAEHLASDCGDGYRVIKVKITAVGGRKKESR